MKSALRPVWLFVCFAILPGVAVYAQAQDDAASRVVANRLPVMESEASLSVQAPATDKKDDLPIVRRDDRLLPRLAGKSSVAQAATVKAGSNWTGWMGWWKSLLPLLIVLVLIGAMAALVKRYAPQRLRANLAGGGVIDMIARQHLTPKQSVALLKIGRRIVVVGMTPDRITRLDTIEDSEEVAELIGRAGSSRPDSLSSSFQREVLKQVAVYDPSADGKGKTKARDTRESVYTGAREQVQGLLKRVQTMTRAL